MPPRTIAQRYELESKVGSGGMGTVWKAKDLLLDRIVAVKLLHDGLADDAAFGERFRREARSAARLGHPNVVAVYDTGQDPDGAPFIVMEYVEGESLHQMLHRTGPLPVEDTARIARSILAGLAHAHNRGLVHRDMKPANVLFDTTHEHAKVVDFGIAKGLDETGGLTRTSGMIGTAAYLSPEQVNGHDAGPASDLYAVGCLLYACLTGEPPFAGSTPVTVAMKHLNEAVPPLSARRPDVPPDFEAVIRRSLEKDPARRFSSAEQMEAAVAATGLDQRSSSHPVIAAATLPATRAIRQHPVAKHPVGGAVQVGPVGPVGTEVLTRGAGPRAGSSSRWLAPLAAFLVVAAIAAVFALWYQNRDPGLIEAPLPTLEPTQAPTATPTEEPTPDPTDEPTPRPSRTPLLDLPGLDLSSPEEDEQESPTPPPSATPTEEP